MSMHAKNIESLIGGAAVVAAALGLTVGLAPASAAPAQSPGVNLSWAYHPGDKSFVALTVQGVYPMSEGAAHELINNIKSSGRGGIEYNIFADDQGENDTVVSGAWFPGAGVENPSGAHLFAGKDGVHFGRVLTVRADLLNEDKDPNWGIGDTHDEIYVQTRFVPGDGSSRGATTNLVSGQF